MKKRLKRIISVLISVIMSSGADANGDGIINGKDGVLLAQYLAEWDVTLG